MLRPDDAGTLIGLEEKPTCFHTFCHEAQSKRVESRNANVASFACSAKCWAVRQARAGCHGSSASSCGICWEGSRSRRNGGWIQLSIISWIIVNAISDAWCLQPILFHVCVWTAWLLLKVLSWSRKKRKSKSRSSFGCSWHAWEPQWTATQCIKLWFWYVLVPTVDGRNIQIPSIRYNPLAPKVQCQCNLKCISPNGRKNQTPNITFGNTRAETLRFGGAGVQHSTCCRVWIFCRSTVVI